MTPLRYAFLILAAGMALRAGSALGGMAMIFPDEHFQTLEPASSAVYGFGWKSWEWYPNWGIRSWTVPGLFMPVLATLKFLGIYGGPASILLCRLWIALWGSLGLWGFHRLLRDRGVRPLAQLTALGVYCLSPAMIAWSASTFSETWALIALWGAMPYAITAVQSKEPRQWIIAGMLLGISFTMRLQMAAWVIGWALVLIWNKQDRKALGYGALGYLVPVLASGILDWVTWGRPFHTTIRNIEANIFEGVADLNGRMPWYDYFPKIWDNLGPLTVIAISALILNAILLRSMKLRKTDLLILVPAVVFLGVHSLIGHKETRFILPMFPVIFYFFAVALDGLVDQVSERLLPAVVVGCVILTPVAGYFARLPERFNVWDLSVPCLAIQREGGLRGGKLLLVDRYWIYTRGEMLFGGKTAHEDVKSREITINRVLNCPYAILPSEVEDDFRRRTAGVEWFKVLEDVNHHVLLRRRP